MSRLQVALAAFFMLGGTSIIFAQNTDPPPPDTVPTFPSETSITIGTGPPPANVNDPSYPWWNATVSLQFQHAQAQVTKWGAANREGSTFNIDVEAVRPATTENTPDGTTSTHERLYQLGGLANGAYKVRVTSRGQLLREKTFTVGQSPPPDEVPAHVTLTVDASDRNHVKAKAHIEFQGYYTVAEQFAPTRDNLGRYLLQARVEPAAVIAIFPPPPFPVVDLNYDLGAVSEGEHVADFRMNGRTYAEKPFVVGNDPPEIEARVTARIDPTSAGAVAHVRIELPNPYFEMTDPGQPVRDGSTIRINATLVPIATFAPIPAPKIIEQDYQLGPLEHGGYRLLYQINGVTKLEMPFFLGDPPPPDVPAQVTATVESTATGSVAHVRINLPNRNYEMIDPGHPVREGQTISIDALFRFRPSPLPATETIERDYNLGALPAGDYRLVYKINGQKKLDMPFRVGSQPPAEKLVSVDVQDRNGEWFGIINLMLMPDLGVMPPAVVKEGNHFHVDVVLTQLGRPISEGDQPRPVRLEVSLGTPSPGDYVFSASLEGVTRRKEFHVNDGPPPPPPGARLAFIEVHRNNAGGQSAQVGIVVPPGKTVSDWGTIRREENTFHVAITLADAPAPPEIIPFMTGPDAPQGDVTFQGHAGVIFRGDGSVTVPINLVRHTYDLGTLEPGEYFFAVHEGDRLLGKRAFRVGEVPPPPPPAIASIEIHRAADGQWNAMVRVVLSKPGQTVLDWGQAETEGRHFRANITIGAAPTDPTTAGADANGVPVLRPVLSRTYALGALEPGEYSFAVLSDGQQLGLRFFRVIEQPPPPPPPGPRVAFIEIHEGDASTVAEVGLLLPAVQTVLDWGEVRIDGTTFKAAVTIGDAPATDPATGNSAGTADNNTGDRRLVRHTYSLGIVEPGEYKFVLCDASNNEALGARMFRVGPKPPPPPPPQPVVAYIRPGQANAGWFVEVGLAFERPGLEVKSWGTPAREGNKFKVSIEIGEATPPPNTDPPPGGNAVFYGNGTAADEPPSVVPAAELDRFGEIGGWPSHLVRHRYELGALDDGEYVFVVCLGDTEAARKAFVVGDPHDDGPTITVQAETIVKKSDAPQTFTLLYQSRSGFESDPSGGPVTVKGPHGFEGEAKLLDCIPSLDPIGMLFACRYEIEGPGGDWDAGDNGEYEVCVDPGKVVSRNGQSIRVPCVFGWRVRIEAEPPPHLDADVAVLMRDGKWEAAVSFENTGNWFSAEWGEVRVHGPVFSTFAQLRELPPGSAAPIPVSFEHIYVLGELRPGRYSFVFKSNAGHCATAAIDVPGVEPPTPLDQWKLNVLGTNAGDDNADDDRDGLPLFGEFYLACQPNRNDRPEVTPALVLGADGEWHLALNFRRVTGGDASLRCIVEVSRDLVRWQDAGSDVDLVPGAPDVDGTQSVCACQRAPLRRSPWPFMRIKLQRTAP